MSLRYRYKIFTASIHAFSLCYDFTAVTIVGSNMVAVPSTLILLQEVFAQHSILNTVYFFAQLFRSTYIIPCLFFLSKGG